MSTTTLTPEARRNVALFSMVDFGAPGVNKFKKQKSDGTTALILQKVPVFRSGTFRDSMGYQHTWDDIHMQQMVNHWNLLRDRKILESVPVRKGHGGFLSDPMDSLIGWHTNLVTEKRANPIDGKEYTYLDADFEILDKDAQEKIDSGLWRNLSAEISSYVTNDEMELWPVYSGVAYVDFSAVEGLREFSKNNKQFSLMFENDKEAPAVGDQNNNGPAQQGTSGTGEGQTQPTQQTQQTGGTSTEGQQVQQNQTPPTEQNPAASSAETGSTTGTEGDAADHTKGGTMFVFKLNGQPSAGIPIAGLSGVQLQAFMSAQAHIDSLEGYRQNMIKSHREDFVKGLAEGQNPIILASQIPSLTEAALEMSDSAFAKWSAAFTASAPSSTGTPPQQLFQQHGAQPGDTNGQPQVQADQQQREYRISVLNEIVADFRRSGYTQERLEKLDAWKELQQLTAQSTTQS
jgi:hypothetical protein